MGRLALRKIDPNLDLTPFLKSIADLPSPYDTATLFGRQAPLEIEVGSGKGLFLSTASERSRDHNFLGIEVSKKYARFTASRLAEKELTNALVVGGDAQQVFAELLPAAAAVAVHVYFPDPWWKTRHRKRRVMNDAFLRNVERVLVKGGSLHFWTDVKDYFDATLRRLATATTLAGPYDVPEPTAEHNLDYRTHFERRMRQHGEPVYRCEFRKEQ